MRRIINSTNVSLDGVVEIMGRWGWHFEYVDDAFDELTRDHLAACDALLMGRRTYESFAEASRSQTGDYADRINSMKKYVASTTLEKADWTNSTVIDGDLVEEVTKIKELPGQDILMFGFGPVARTLLQHDLLDEIRLWIDPVLVGAGGPSDLVFRDGRGATTSSTRWCWMPVGGRKTRSSCRIKRREVVLGKPPTIAEIKSVVADIGLALNLLVPHIAGWVDVPKTDPDN